MADFVNKYKVKVELDNGQSIDAGEIVGVVGATPNITAKATVDDTIGNPQVEVSQSGTPEDPEITFAFTGLRGDTGPVGPIGPTPDITISATVERDGETPECVVTKSGTPENPDYSLAFSGIKGDKGDTGATGSISASLEAFWTSVGAGEVPVRAGDQFIMEIGGALVPVTCLEAILQGGAGITNSTWQVSFNQRHIMSDSEVMLSWDLTSMKSWLNNTVYNQLPDYMKNVLVNHSTSLSSRDSLSLLSATQIWGKGKLPEQVSLNEESTDYQFDYYKQLLGENADPTVANFRLKSNYSVWTRSQYSNMYAEINPTGKIARALGSDSNCVIFYFSVAN